MQVEQPEIRKNLRALDFGAGFYLTSSKRQASRWAKAIVRRRGRGAGTVNQYAYDESKSTGLTILEFKQADGEWLDFVVANRKGLQIPQQYDIVIGPVANDATLDVINDYMAGRFTKEIAVELLKPQNLTDQYVFLTEKALQTLRFEGSEQA